MKKLLIITMLLTSTICHAQHDLFIDSLNKTIAHPNDTIIMYLHASISGYWWLNPNRTIRVDFGGYSGILNKHYYDVDTSGEFTWWFVIPWSVPLNLGYLIDIYNDQNSKFDGAQVWVESPLNVSEIIPRETFDNKMYNFLGIEIFDPHGFYIKNRKLYLRN